MSSVTTRWFAVPACAGVLGMAAVFGLALAAALSEPAGTTVPAWWAASGVAVGLVATAAGRTRLVMIAAIPMVIFVAVVLAGSPLAAAACLAVAGAAQAAITGWWLGRRGPPELLTLRDLGTLLAAAGMGAVLAGGIVAGGIGLLSEGDPWTAWLAVATSHGAAVIVLVPQVMRVPPWAGAAGRAEAAVLWAVVTVTTLVVFAPGQRLPLVFLPAAVLVWAGLRVGIRTVSIQLAVAGAIAVFLTTQGAGPFALVGGSLGPVVSGAMVHAFLVACTLVVVAFTLSVTERDAALAAVADQRQFDRAILGVVNAGVLVCEADGHVVLRNAAYRRVVGVGDDEEVDDAELVERVQLSEDGVPAPADRTPLHDALAGAELTDAPMQARFGSGSPHEILVTARQVHSADGRLLGAVSAFTDVTAEHAMQVRMRESVAFHDGILAVIPDDIYLLDLTNLKTVWATRTLASRLGYSPGEVRDGGWGQLEAVVHPGDVEAVRSSYAGAARLADGEIQSLRVRVLGRDGQYRWLSRRVTPYSRDPDGRVRQVIGVRHAAELVEAEQLLAEAALHDPLTGLPNRRLLGDRLDAALAKAATTDELVAVLFCDLDGFKRVNDTGGHAAGDALLKASAKRLRAVLRPEDTVARVGGDEFVIILAPEESALGDPTELREAAVTVARRITASLAQPIQVTGMTYAVTVSVGLTFARPGDTAEQTMRGADTAMYRAKTRGKNRFELFDRTRSGRGARRVSGA